MTWIIVQDWRTLTPSTKVLVLSEDFQGAGHGTARIPYLVGYGITPYQSPWVSTTCFIPTLSHEAL